MEGIMAMGEPTIAEFSRMMPVSYTHLIRASVIGYNDLEANKQVNGNFVCHGILLLYFCLGLRCV